MEAPVRYPPDILQMFESVLFCSDVVQKKLFASLNGTLKQKHVTQVLSLF